MRAWPAAALVLLLATGCASGEDPGVQPGPARIDVDTPELRAIKAEAAIAPCQPGAGSGTVEGGFAEVTLPCLGGGPSVDLSTLRGPLVVNAWAAWCGPCREELPIYQRFAEKYDGRVGVLGIDFNDPQPKGALELARDAGVTYPLLADPQSELAGPPPGIVPRGLPMLALVDESGRVVHLEAVQIRSVSQLEDLVDEHLGLAS